MTWERADELLDMATETPRRANALQLLLVQPRQRRGGDPHLRPVQHLVPGRMGLGLQQGGIDLGQHDPGLGHGEAGLEGPDGHMPGQPGIGAERGQRGQAENDLRADRAGIGELYQFTSILNRS